jgi:hypothetical protein
MSILKNFDMAALRAERARNAARGSVSLVEGLKQIAPEIEKLKVGETAKLAIPGFGSDENATRKFVMSITAKLTNLTVRGGDWEGYQFDVASDGQGSLYVQRGEDLKGKNIRERKARGPRAKSASNDSGTAPAGTEVTGEGATVTQH